MTSFVYSANPSRVVFGRGTLEQLGPETERLGMSRVLIIAGPHQDAAVDRAAAALGSRVAGRFGGVAMHTPVEVSERAAVLAREAGADGLVAIGGGSATGLGKAVTLRNGLPLIAVPTTYAGSEVTPVLGETQGSSKTTRTDPAVLPRTVIYDVDLTLGLPIGLTVTSGVNAMAHAVEALYSAQAGPITDAMAVDAIGRLAQALPRIAAEPSDVDARSEALIGAFLAGTCLGTVGMGLHHRLCHILGGTFGLPHAPTHSVLLPHVMAYNSRDASAAMARAAAALGVADAPAGMFDLVASLGGPTSLAGIGMSAADVESAAELAARTPGANPREVTADAVRELLRTAFAGRRPSASADRADVSVSAGLPDVGWLTRAVVASFAAAPGRLRHLLGSLVVHLHTYARENDVTQDEWGVAIDFLTRTGQVCTATRQEFVLLSDTLGVSSVVDLLANSRSPATTPSAVLGPFYVDGPPVRDQGADIAGGLAGTPLWTDVRIVDTDGTPVPGATVDVWQSNEDGFYDVQLPDLDGPVLRARFTSDHDGRVRFWSILPSQYPIPTDGPVGQLLTASGRHPYRAPHLHFLIEAPRFRRLITQLFVAGGAYLDSDAVFGVKRALIVPFAPGDGPTPPGRPVDGNWRRLEYTFSIAPTQNGQPENEGTAG